MSLLSFKYFPESTCNKMFIYQHTIILYIKVVEAKTNIPPPNNKNLSYSPNPSRSALDKKWVDKWYTLYAIFVSGEEDESVKS